MAKSSSKGSVREAATKLAEQITASGFPCTGDEVSLASEISDALEVHLVLLDDEKLAKLGEHLPWLQRLSGRKARPASEIEVRGSSSVLGDDGGAAERDVGRDALMALIYLGRMAIKVKNGRTRTRRATAVAQGLELMCAALAVEDHSH